MITNRHIRHDWKTFVDWEQKSVRTVCRATSRQGLAGIPGITDQKNIVNVGGKNFWGWCINCVRFSMPEAIHSAQSPDMNDFMRPQYDRFIVQIGDQYRWIVDKGLRAARQAERDGVH